MGKIHIYEVVKKLIGPIDPVGESYADEKSLENLKGMTELVTLLLYKIHTVARDNETRHEASRKEAGQFARKFLNTHNNGI